MNRVGTLLEMGAELCEKQNHAEGIALLEEAARLDPRNALVQYELGFCYAGGCGPHARLNPQLAIEHLRVALRESETCSSPLLRARILSAMGNAYMAATGMPPTTRLLSAIDCCHESAALYHRHGKPEDRAREQFNEANAWCELPEDAFAEKWERAIVLYREALAVRTRHDHPERYAATMHNLGTAYRELKSGNRARNVARAIGCYRAALRVRTAAAAPLKNAGLHNNLGNAYVTLAQIDREHAAKHARRALRHFDLALHFYSRTEHPCDYALTQFNRGHAWLLALSENAEAALRQAAVCFRQAQECFALCGRTAYSEAARQRLEQLQPILSAH